MILYSNNASTTLASEISNSATTIVVATGTGSLFPTISSVDDYFNVTITDSAKHIEIVTVTARTGDTFTVMRGMENTTARAWLASDILELRITKGLLDQLKLDATKDTASNLSAHTSNTSNPHSVTATQVGLGNVTNESKATMFTSPTFTGNAVLGAPASGDFSTGTFTWPTFNQNTSGNAATATYATSAGDAGTLDSHDSTYFATASNLSSHTGNTSNPHSVTAAQVGLGNVENKSSATIRSEITSSNVTTALGFTPLSTTGTAADSDKLDGQHGSYYQPASSAITTSNIGSQSVAYASSAGSAGNGGVTSVNGMTGAVTLSTGGVTSLNGQTGAITNTTLYAIGSYVIGRPSDTTHYVVDSTVAGSSLYATHPNGVCKRINVYDYVYDEFGGIISSVYLYSYYEWKIEGTAWSAGETLVNIGSWRCVSPAIQAYIYGCAGLWVRYA